ncbi:TonB-dependent receptor [Filimonas lacunae]|nr:TonB-dependent receptor [Filimonas lacunae]
MLMAQVTTGTISGSVKVTEGKPVAGATITATLQSTGSVYTSTSRDNGRYTLPNLLVGGPYTITFKFIGLKDEVINDVYVTLGTPLVINSVLQDAANTLNDVKVTANSGKSPISSQRTGAATYISSRMMQAAPTISRSIQDFARLAPQAKVGSNSTSGNGAGISIGGQGNRYNQFSVDGANANDGFGLSSTGANGGQANLNPISVETIQEVQIVMSPYDVTQGGFTGGGINAVTKSGTNTFHGSAYGQYQNQNFIGKSPGYDSGIARIQLPSFKNSTYGASLGGPIIKNKLFFYANVERFKKTTPLAYDPTVAGSGSLINTKVMDSLKTYLMDKWGYDPGTYGAISLENQSTSVFARIDWNINSKHKLAFRYNHVDGSNDNISRGPTSAVFSNGGYIYRNKTNSFVAELNSSFNSNASNVLRITYSAIRDNNGSKNPFPTISIYQTNQDNKQNILYNIGTSNSFHANGLKQDVITITDNFTLYKGKHTLTFGTNNEFFKSDNIFLQNFFGNYTFGSTGTYANPNVANFVNGANPTTYQVGFSNSTDKNDKANAKLSTGQFSVYAQDLFTVNDRLRFTYGIRLDLPMFFTSPAENTAFNTAFASYGVQTNQKPSAQLLYSPRVGFNWDVKGDATTQLRGGVGLFTGRVPFVWVSNQYTNTGVASSAYNPNAAAITAANIKFNYVANDAHKGAYLPAAGTPSNLINVTDKKFKFPQVLRGNLAVDHKLNIWGLIGTLEAVYTKTVNNAYVSNLNLSENGEGTVTLGPTKRPLWTTRANTTYGDVMKLNNTSKGYAYNLTAQIQKPLSRGWSGSIAYTYGHSTSLSDMTSSVATSNWRGTLVANGLNHPDVATSNFNLGSRIVAYVSKEFKYAKHFGTTITLIYTGQSGQRLSYLYGSNILGDDPSSPSAATTLVYLPKTQAEANFVDIKGGATATQQWADFQSFVSNNSYLKSHLGEVTKRNADKMPFESHFDLRLAQDFYIKGSHKIQLFVDVFNITNLINKDWGWSYVTSTSGDGLFTSSKTLFTVINSGAQTQDGAAITPTAANPGLQFNAASFRKIKGTRRIYDVSDFNSRWNSQIGIRYSF